MSELLSYLMYTTGDARKAATMARRLANDDGFGGLRVLSNVEQSRPTNSGQRRFLVSIEARERRVSDQMAAWRQYVRIHRSLVNGTAVRTKVEGADYSDRSRHVMPAGSVGLIAGRRSPNFRVAFEQLPGRTFLYAPQDLEVLA